MKNVAYYNLETQQYPLYVGDLALENVDVNDLPEHIVEVVVDVPEWDSENEHLREELPTQDEEGIWRANFVTVQYTDEEKKLWKLTVIRRKVASHEVLTMEEALLLTEV